jgi:hypothetical protein
VLISNILGSFLVLLGLYVSLWSFFFFILFFLFFIILIVMLSI